MQQWQHHRAAASHRGAATRCDAVTGESSRGPLRRTRQRPLQSGKVRQRCRVSATGPEQFASRLWWLQRGMVPVELWVACCRVAWLRSMPQVATLCSACCAERTSLQHCDNGARCVVRRQRTSCSRKSPNRSKSIQASSAAQCACAPVCIEPSPRDAATGPGGTQAHLSMQARTQMRNRACTHAHAHERTLTRAHTLTCTLMRVHRTVVAVCFGCTADERLKDQRIQVGCPRDTV